MDMSNMSSMGSMPGMTMTGSMPSSTTDANEPLSTAGLDMSNSSVQSDFLAQLLHDTDLQVSANSYARRYWYGIVTVIGLAVILNIIMRTISSSRIKAAATDIPRPGGDSNLLHRIIGGVAGIFRKITYPQVSPVRHTKLLKLPPLGIIILLLFYLTFVLVLEFVNQDVPGEQHRQAIGVRAGWLTISQLPLLILLSGKVNLIGLITGVGYERLNVLHRWVARTMLLTATLHMGYQQGLWNDLGLLQLEWTTDTCPPTGIKAYAFLVWLNLTTLAPVRNLWYELFVIQHILSFFCFIVFIMLHLPSTALYSRVYIWIPIGLYLGERLLRSLRYAYNNIRPGRATLIHQHGGVTKVVVHSRQLKSWTPGSFVLLSLPRFGLGQSHPATISSIPSSHEGKLVFFLRAHHGFTSRIHENSSVVSLQESPVEAVPSKTTHLALIDGPYGGKHLDFASFGSVMLIAGSTGVTFTLPILLDIAFRAQKQRLPVKEVTFIWAVKTSGCTSWIASELQQAADELYKAGVTLSIRVYVTVDVEFVEESAGESVRIPANQSCHCDKTPGECSCISPTFNQPIPQTKEASSNESQISETDIKAEAELGLGKKETEAPVAAYIPRIPTTTMHAGRPDIPNLVAEAQQKSLGEMGVAVCGPIGLSAETRRVVAQLEGKGTGIYLHAESFGW